MAFWGRREAPISLGLVRIGVGGVALWDLLWARALGLVPGVWAPPPFGLGVGAVDSNPPLVVRWLGATPHTSELVWLAATVAAAMLFTGTLTPLAGIGFALASAELAALAPFGDRGIDVLLRVAAVLLGLSGAGTLWSVDAWIGKALGRFAPRRVPAWPRYLLFVQLVWVYFSAVEHRADTAWWPSGSFKALSSILSDPHYARLTPGWAERIFPVTQIATVTTMLFESTAPLMVLWTWFERTPRAPGRIRRIANRLKLRWVWLGTGLVFHVGIALTLRLGIFPFGTLALYPALFHPDEIAAFARKLRWKTAAVS